MTSARQTSNTSPLEELELPPITSSRSPFRNGAQTGVPTRSFVPGHRTLNEALPNDTNSRVTPSTTSRVQLNTMGSRTPLNLRARVSHAEAFDTPRTRSNISASSSSMSIANISESSQPVGRNTLQREHDVVSPASQVPDLLPIDVPDGFDEINFKPAILRTSTLCGILLFNVGCLVGLLLVVYKADAHKQFHPTSGNMHFVVRYVPTTVGTLTTVIFRSMRDTFSRIQPYIAMSNNPRNLGARGTKTIGSAFVPMLYWGKRKHRFHPRHQDWLRWAMFWGSILTAQITGYKAALFSASLTPEGTWVITVQSSMAFVLFSLYSIVIVLTIMTLIKMTSNKTGLKWDPITIADQLALFHGSNALKYFRALEQYHRERAFDLLAERSFRLGYWKRPDDTLWYGIGTATPSATTVERDIERARNPTETYTLHNCQKWSKHHATFCSCNGDQRCSVYPWTKNPIFAPWTVFFWGPLIFASFCICVYTIASKRVYEGFTIHNTWWKHFQFSNLNSTTLTNSTNTSTMNITSQPGDRPDLLLDLGSLNFSPANDLVLYVFVFRSLLVIFGSYFAIAWFSGVDQSTRLTQPFANMYKREATASESILLDYLWGLPGLVTYEAFSNSHYKVAWFSLLDLASPIFPILVGGLFTIKNTGELIVFTIVPVTFYFVLAYLAIYLITFLFVFPGRKRRLLRFHFSIADYASLFYASHLLNDTNPEDLKPDTLDISGKAVTSRHLYSRVFLEEGKYTMGFYTGTDGESHWGLERSDLADVEFLTPKEFRSRKAWTLQPKETPEAP